MLTLLSPIILLVFAVFVARAENTIDVWPLPQQYSFPPNAQQLTFTPNAFKITQQGTSALLDRAIQRYTSLIFFRNVAPPHQSNDFDTPLYQKLRAVGKIAQGQLTTLSIIVSSPDETLNQTTNETYSLTLRGPSSTLRAQTVYGALRGLETFSQLVSLVSSSLYAITEIDIIDYPRFAYRSFLVDTSRHYIPLSKLMLFVDAMSYTKLNVLHWHIVDDQSFPFVSSTFPGLSVRGAYTPSQIFTQKDVQSLINYARDRGVRVIPEFDTPGHTQSWGLGYPFLLTDCYTNGVPDGTKGPMNALNDTIYDFLTSFFKEITSVFPHDYVHIGGDEVSFDCWKSNPVYQKWMAAQNSTDYGLVENYYENHLLQILDSLDRDYVAWQELFDNGLTLRPNTIIDVWKGGSNISEELRQVTAKGFQVVVSSPWYLNYISYGADWKQYYDFEPFSFNGTDKQKNLIIGGGASMWGEYVDETNLISRSFPRGAAPAERLWSNKSVRDVKDAERRLGLLRCLYVRRGIPAEPCCGPSYCDSVLPF